MSDERLPGAALPADSAAVSDRSALYSMGALTKLTAADMRLILRHYEQPGSSEQYVSHRELTGGLSNSNYRLDTSRRALLCKVCDEKPIHAVAAQVRALAMLRPYELPIAYPISRTDSQPPPEQPQQQPGRHQTADPAAPRLPPSEPHCFILSLPQFKPIVLYQFLHGSPPKQATDGVMRQIGQAQAALHAVDGSDFDFLPSFPMGVAEMQPFLSDELPLLPSSVQQHPFVAFLRAELSRALRLLSSAAAASPCVSVLHGDLFLENVVFADDGRLLGLIDFEEACVGPRLLDVAMTVTGCCYDAEQRVDHRLAEAFLSSYSSRHSLSEAECALLVDFVRYACLAIAFWRFRQFNVRVVDAARTDSYAPMVARIQRLGEDGPDRHCIDRIIRQHLHAHSDSSAS